MPAPGCRTCATVLARSTAGCRSPARSARARACAAASHWTEPPPAFDGVEIGDLERRRKRLHDLGWCPLDHPHRMMLGARAGPTLWAVETGNGEGATTAAQQTDPIVVL